MDWLIRACRRVGERFLNIGEGGKVALEEGPGVVEEATPIGIVAEERRFPTVFELPPENRTVTEATI